jgi:hypothetical protein
VNDARQAAFPVLIGPLPAEDLSKSIRRHGATMTFRELTEIYAVLAREFSEAVAQLGRVGGIGPELLILMQEIKRRHMLCDAAGDDLERYISQERPARGESVAKKADWKHLPQAELLKIEADLRERLLLAKEAHQKAKQDAADLARLGNDLGPGNPDGRLTMLNAAHIEGRALQHYVDALAAYNDFVLCHSLLPGLPGKAHQ